MIGKISKILILGCGILTMSTWANAQVTMNNLDQNADQSQGQYMPMDLGYAGFSSLGMTQAAWLDPLQNLGEGQSRPAYSKYYWSPDLVLPIRLREGMMTLVNFPDWELIEDMYIGDNAAVDGQITGPNTVLLYPRKGANVGVDTNIIIFGRSGNRYVFYVKSEGVNTERLTNSIIDIEVLNDGNSGGNNSFGGRGSSGNFSSGAGKSVASTMTKRNQRNNWIEEIPVDPSKFRFDIEIYVPNPDDVVIAPERVWRDDIFTYIDLGAKALNMVQRPIVTMIVERSEVPVGFRTKGPNNRLIIVEGIGDMVLRNGKRMVCLKLRRSDDVGLENISYADDLFANEWSQAAPIPARDASDFGDGMMMQGIGNNTRELSGGLPGNMGYPNNAGGNGSANGGYPTQGNSMLDIYYPPSVSNQSGAADNFDYSQMQRITNTQDYSNSNSFVGALSYGQGLNGAGSGDVSIELGTDSNVSNLEALWADLSKKYSDLLTGYEPYYSVDTPADGHGKELFHLRIGPIKKLEDGDMICSRLGRNGVFCSVVRTQ